MSKSTRNILLIGAALIVLIVLADAVYIVSETNQVIITQFGEPIGGAVTKPGVHFKTPFIQKPIILKNAGWNGRAMPIRSRPKTKNISGWKPIAAGESAILLGFSRESRMNGERNPAWMTSSTAKRGTPSPITT